MTSLLVSRDFLFLAFALLLRIINPDFSNYSFLVLAIYSLTGPKQIIKAFAFTWLFSMLNPALTPYASSAVFLRYLVIFAGLFSIILRWDWQYLRGFNLWTLFSVFLYPFMHL